MMPGMLWDYLKPNPEAEPLYRSLSARCTLTNLLSIYKGFGREAPCSRRRVSRGINRFYRRGIDKHGG